MSDIKLIKSKDFEKIYSDMKIQFPPDELKDENHLKTLFESNYYDILEAYDNDKNVGYLCTFVDKEQNTLWLDYFAVFKKYHSQGYGTKILEAVKKFQYKGCILEVEKPCKDKPNTLRRIRFYETLGAVKVPCNYHFPNKDGSIELDLYYLPLLDKSLPDNNYCKTCIKNAFKNLHFNIIHVDEVYKKITFID